MLYEIKKKVDNYNHMLDTLSEYELSVMEDVIEFGENEYKLTRCECIDNIETITKQYWSAVLG